jgi:glycosyltransferase involved in cell wall biosynthesis
MVNHQKLSVTVITFNEEKRIRQALESVKWADEIVVVDSLSTDLTVAICQTYTDRISQIPWHGHVRQKQIAVENASSDWILSIDADEVVSPELAEEIRQVLAGTPAYQGYYVPRKTWYLGGWVEHCGWYPDYKLRLFHKAAGKWGGKDPHDKVELEGPTAYLRHDLYHYSYENIADHLQKINAYTTTIAARKSGRIGGGGIFARAVLTFFKKYLVQHGFRDGTRGIIVCLMSSFYEALKYAKLWERQVESEGGAE